MLQPRFVGFHVRAKCLDINCNPFVCPDYFRQDVHVIERARVSPSPSASRSIINHSFRNGNVAKSIDCRRIGNAKSHWERRKEIPETSAIVSICRLLVASDFSLPSFLSLSLSRILTGAIAQRSASGNRRLYITSLRPEIAFSFSSHSSHCKGTWGTRATLAYVTSLMWIMRSLRDFGETKQWLQISRESLYILSWTRNLLVFFFPINGFCQA